MDKRGDATGAVFAALAAQPPTDDFIASALGAIVTLSSEGHEAQRCVEMGIIEILLPTLKKTKSCCVQKSGCRLVSRLCTVNTVSVECRNDIIGKLVKGGCGEAVAGCIKLALASISKGVNINDYMELLLVGLDAISDALNLCGVEIAKKGGGVALDASLSILDKQTFRNDVDMVRASLRVVCSMLRFSKDTLKKVDNGLLLKMQKIMEEEYPSVPSIQSGGLGVLAEYWKYGVDAQSLGHWTGFVCQCMRRHWDSISVLKMGCGAIGIASRSSPMARIAVEENGGLDCLLDVLAESHNVRVVVHALGAFTDLMSIATATTAAASNKKAAGAVAAPPPPPTINGGIRMLACERIVMTMERFRLEAKVQSYCLKAAAAMSTRDEEAAFQFWSIGIHRKIGRALRDHGKSCDDVAKAAFICISDILTASQKTKTSPRSQCLAETMGDLGRMVLEYMEYYGEDGELQRMGAGALKLMVGAKPTTFSDMFVELKEAIVRIMVAHPKDPKLQILCCDVLAAMK